MELRACLESLAALNYPRDAFEVVVVDDGGDAADNAASAFGDTLNVRIIAQRHAGPATARNRGVGHARGEYMAFTDDDCLADPDWLTALERALIEQPQAIVGGATHNVGGSSIYARASQGIVDFLYEYYSATNTGARFFATNNLGCRRDRLLSLGGFDESFPRAAAEDRDLCERWSEAGRPFHFAGEAKITHVLRVSLSRYVRQHFRYGQGANYLHRARARRGKSLPRLEPLRFYYRLVTYPLRAGTGLSGLLMLALAAVSQVVYGLGYYSERALARLRDRRVAKTDASGAGATPPPAAAPKASPGPSPAAAP